VNGNGACTCDANFGGSQCDVYQGGGGGGGGGTPPPPAATLTPGSPLAPVTVLAATPLSYTLPPSSFTASRVATITAALAPTCAPWLALAQTGAGGMTLSLSGTPSAAQVATLLTASADALLCPILVRDASDAGVNATLGVTLHPLWQPSPPAWVALAPQAATIGQRWSTVLRVGQNVTDADAALTGETVTLSLTAAPAWVQGVPAIGSLTLTGTPGPGARETPVVTITLLATDGTGVSTPATLTLTVHDSGVGPAGCVVCAASGEVPTLVIAAGTPTTASLSAPSLFTTAPGANPPSTFTALVLPAASCGWLRIMYDGGQPSLPYLDGMPPKAAARVPCLVAVTAINVDGFNATALVRVNVTNSNGTSADDVIGITACTSYHVPAPPLHKMQWPHASSPCCPSPSCLAALPRWLLPSLTWRPCLTMTTQPLATC